ncbi:MAG: hypothetical protein ACKO1M_08765 [Planctomycetota bacterium]
MPKVLAWMSLGLALLFVALSLTGLFGWNSLGDDTADRLQTARMLFTFGALPALGGSLLLAAVLLALSAFRSRE